MFVLAHLSDPHLSPLPRPRLGELLNKRGLGYLNWQRKRGAVHRADVLEALLRDLRSQTFNHLAVTGDLINIGLDAEIVAAAGWLEDLGVSDEVTLVPGNHDAYVPMSTPRMLRDWAPYMQGDDLASFPFVRRRGTVAMIGLSSALPTGPFMASGRLGRDQLASLEKMLISLKGEGLFRVVLIHHPPTSRLKRYLKRLTDGAQLQAVLRKAGAELVIHGHDHVQRLTWLDGPDRLIPVVGVPSASASSGGRHQPAGYNMYEIDGAPGAWRCGMIARGFERGGREIKELARQTLAG